MALGRRLAGSRWRQGSGSVGVDPQLKSPGLTVRLSSVPEDEPDAEPSPEHEGGKGRDSGEGQ